MLKKHFKKLSKGEHSCVLTCWYEAQDLIKKFSTQIRWELKGILLAVTFAHPRKFTFDVKLLYLFDFTINLNIS